MSRIARTAWILLALVALAACARVEAPWSSSPTMRGPDPDLHLLEAGAGERVVVAFELANDGGAPLTITAASDVGWLRVLDGDATTIAPGARGAVVVEAACAEAASVRYGSVAIDGSDGARVHGTVRLACQGDPSEDGDDDRLANEPPRAVITSDPPDGDEPAPVTVTFSGSTSHDEDGEVVSYRWTIDGVSYEGPTARHRFEAPGRYDVELEVEDDRGGVAATAIRYSTEGADDDVPGSDPEPEGSFDITLVFYGSQQPTPSQRTAFENAAARWSEVVTGEMPDRSEDLPGGACFGNDHPPYRGTIDDLLIFASVVPIDGEGDVLAMAGPCRIRAGYDLPYVGLMQFDSADVAGLESQGLFEATVLHEMGHVLGIGTMWEYGGRDMVDPVGSYCSGYAETARFNGSEATRHHQEAGGSGHPHVETDHGDGTACGHWDEDRYRDEMMTGFIGRSMPLSAMTIGSLRDIGYEVSYDAADDYRVPSGLLLQEERRDVRLGEVLLSPTAPPD